MPLPHIISRPRPCSACIKFTTIVYAAQGSLIIDNECAILTLSISCLSARAPQGGRPNNSPHVVRNDSDSRPTKRTTLRGTLRTPRKYALSRSELGISFRFDSHRYLARLGISLDKILEFVVIWNTTFIHWTAVAAMIVSYLGCLGSLHGLG
ncbi:hypothetical protein BKA58DRAFT_33592 [Alternaria rosae]|uniref:uncharacterized protein n=1 Tax=Alternaria rosae TaxID=1187941 RepID=UPI001E8CA91E|nr:uncharacterized protein BKA58DRAFT_33592 [Alternaria rosae]KAH6883251.1 hypothetical protein BKA58DRAFT_33592 [Alternaria rosae]